MVATAQAMSADEVHRKVLRYATGFGIDDDDANSLAVEVVWPQTVSQTAVLFCMPGGAMNRHYFDLPVEGDESFSFARQMAARGFVCVLIDPPGVGGSDRPADGHRLTPQRITDILLRLHEQLVADLQVGRVDADLQALPDLMPLGVGHSMGAMLLVLHQAKRPDYAALALLGFGTQGLAQFLPRQARDRVDDIHALRAALPEIARSTFPRPYAEMRGGGDSGMFGSRKADPRAITALKRAADVLLPVPAMLSMFPGNVAEEAASITVPVYLALGERDLIRDPQAVPENFPASRATTLQVLPETGHSHFLFPARDQLFDGLAEWAMIATSE